jgi:biopolymer transport protein ExbD
MSEEEMPEQISIDVTPLATIALILVIIFMSSSTTWMQPLKKVELPKASTAESERKQNLTVTVADDGELAIDDVDVRRENLFDGLMLGLQNNKDKFVIIRADRRVTYGTIMEIMALAKKAGAANITIATEQKKAKRG